jgi:hypothetical protein
MEVPENLFDAVNCVSCEGIPPRLHRRFRSVGERPPHDNIILRRSSIGAPTEKGQPLHKDPPTYRSVHLMCTKTRGPGSDFFNLSLKFAYTEIRTQDLRSAI